MTARRDTQAAEGPTVDGVVAGLAGILVDDPLRPEQTGDATLRMRVEAGSWRDAASALRAAGIDRLEFLTCVDWDDHLVLTLQAYALSTRLVVRLATELTREEASVATVGDLWPTADWEERETFDQFGVVFEGHPDLRRILNPEAWVGHPLRRDYVDDVHITRPQYF